MGRKHPALDEPREGSQILARVREQIRAQRHRLEVGGFGLQLLGAVRERGELHAGR